MKIDSSTLLIAGVAAVGVYLITRPKVTVPTYNPYLPTTGTALSTIQQPNYVAQDITAGTTALQGISSIISNWF